MNQEEIVFVVDLVKGFVISTNVKVTIAMLCFGFNFKNTSSLVKMVKIKF